MNRKALIIFYDDKGRILLQNRRGISKHGEEWGCFGGEIEFGETPEQALIREVREELSYELKQFFSIGIVKTTDQRGTIERHVFLAPLPGMKLLNQKEGENMQLFTLQEAKKVKNCFGDDQVIKKLEDIGWPSKLVRK
ncbi:NUDIX hydrolase [Candidatus Woesearchaeota archaeon]|nr:NUDIX hydrolase [Candidatus Woesearchaeota archaeon]